MKKITIFAIIFIALLVMPFKADAYQLSQTDSAKLSVEDTNTKSNDKRVRALTRVFERYNSPLAEASRAYVDSADKNGIDWKLLPSIAGLESSFGKKLMPNSYNAYGWGGGRIYFDSWEHGIDTITKALGEKYYARGANTVWTIGPIYAESPTWAVRVDSFMNTIEKEYVEILRNEITITI